MDAQARADDIKAKLLAAEAAHPGSQELAALHASLAAGLTEQADTLGLTGDHARTLAGEPKE